MKLLAKNKILSSTLAAIVTLTVCFAAVSGGEAYAAYAESPVGSLDGTYAVSVSSDMVMGGNTLRSTGKIEKDGDKYYASLTFDTSSLSNIALVIEGKTVGYTSSTDGNWTTYTYTLSASNVSGALPFAARVPAMNRSVGFNVTVGLNGAARISDTVADIGERPAEFIPVFDIASEGNYETSQNSVFIIPSATARLGAEECTVTAGAYYINGDKREEVEISDNRFILKNVGEYHLIYTAANDRYTTSLGNPTNAVLDFTITSVAGSGSLAKFEDTNHVLSDGVAVMAQRLTGGGIYETASAKMASIADNFEVIGVSLINPDGTAATLTDSITLYLKADAAYDRTEIVVYHMAEDGTLTKLDARGYGSFVRTTTDTAGTFIVCVPGVKFVMPVWGYAVILAACAAALAAAITTIILVKKRKKKKQAE
jgi:hypothetical protein